MSSGCPSCTGLSPRVKPGTGLEVLGTDLREIPHIQKIGTDIAKALEVLHSKGLVHLDVKLENLLFTKTNGVLTACLGDFSSVKPVARQYEGKTSFTSSHAAPELRAGMPYSYGVDVYAWGQMMLRLLRSLTASGLNLTAYVANKRGGVNYVWIGEEAGGSQVDSLHATDAQIPFLSTIIRAVNRDPKLRHADGTALLADLTGRIAFASSDCDASSACCEYIYALPQAELEFQDNFKKRLWEEPDGSGKHIDAMRRVYAMVSLHLIRYRDGKCILQETCEGHKTMDWEFDDTISLENFWNLVNLFHINKFKAPKYTREDAQRDWHAYIVSDYDSICPTFRNSIIRNIGKRVPGGRLLRLSREVQPSQIEYTGENGISFWEVSARERSIKIFLTEEFKNHRNCTAYLILNWLDGVLNAFSLRDEPATLTFFTPAEWQGELTELKRYLAAKNPWLKVEEFEEPASLLPKSRSQVATCNEGQKEPAFEAGAKLKDPVMEFTVDNILS